MDRKQYMREYMRGYRKGLRRKGSVEDQMKDADMRATGGWTKAERLVRKEELEPGSKAVITARYSKQKELTAGLDGSRIT